MKLSDCEFWRSKRGSKSVYHFKYADNPWRDIEVTETDGEDRLSDRQLLEEAFRCYKEMLRVAVHGRN
jgi:hypothetical protein